MNPKPLAVLLAFVALAGAAPAAAQSPAPQASPTPPPCSAPENRQFDFWLGEWNVLDPKGQQVGSNTIRSELGGCVLHESWVGADGSVGHSYNVYYAPEKRWHQTWVDNSGSLLELNGGLDNGAMVLRGETPRRQGGRARHRITWSKLAGGRVRQLWETSSDAGKTWTVLFDGTYVSQPKD